MSRFVLVVLAWLLSVGVAHAQGSSFSSPYRLTLAWHSTFDVAIGDVNGDGRKDLVVSTRNAPGWDYTLSIFLQGADGQLARPVDVALPESWVVQYRMALADLDGDGALDIVLGTPNATGVYVVRMTSATTASLVEHPGPGFSCKFIVAGDIDMDGNPDVVCHDEQLTAVAYYGDGHGGFRATRQIPTLAGWYILDYDFKSMQLADVSGDGFPDLLISAGHSSSFHVFTNNRMGGFFPSVAYPHPPSGGAWRSVAIHAADIDGDGVNEVLTATPGMRPFAALNVYRPGPYGYLVLSDRIPVHDSPTAILSGNVGPDGGMKVVLAHYSFNALSVLGEGGGGLRSQFLYDLPGYGNHIDLGDARKQYAIALGDLDGDGCEDLAAATYSGAMILYGCEAFRPSLPVSDFDGDGVSDLLWHHATSSQQYLWQWADINNWYSCRWPEPCPGPLGRRMVAQAVGDFDGDGSSDVFWREPETGENMLRLGAFYSRPITTVTNPDWQVVGAGDFDGDDRADLLWRHQGTGANAIWKSADYATQQPVTRVTDVRWRVVGVGDFDGDGRSDILWRHSTTGANVIWRSANYATQQAVTGVTDLRWEVVGIGDFDGDGRSDIVWRHSATGANAIWKSGNHRTQVPVTGVTDQRWRIAAVGDYNGDGLSDLMWRHSGSGRNTIWLAANSRTQKPVETMGTHLDLVP